MTIEQQLINKLLQKYESSQAYAADEKPIRRIMLRLYDGEFRPYDFEDYETKILVHALVHDLSKKNILDYSWVRGEEEHILDRVWLNLDHTDSAYALAGRKSPKKEALDILARIERMQSEMGTLHDPKDPFILWISDALADSGKVLRRRKKLSAPLPKDRKTAKFLLVALEFWLDRYRQKDAEMPERVFSLLAFSDSKVFEQQVRSRVASLVRRYLVPRLFDETESVGSDLQLSDDEAIGLLGLSRSPEIFELSGPLQLQRDEMTVDPGFFANCLTISAEELDGLQLYLPAQIEDLLFIENRTNFYWLARKRPPKTVLVYHGGCFSPAKGRFFGLLKDAAEKNRHLAVHHWGDIDLGGFLIFNRLKKNFFSDLRPWHMDREDVLSALSQAKTIDSAYARRLQKKLNDAEFKIFHPVIELLLEKQVRLEQEALLGVVV